MATPVADRGDAHARMHAGNNNPKEGDRWFERHPGEPNKTEVLLYALLIVSHGQLNAKELDAWARRVLLDQARARKL